MLWAEHSGEYFPPTVHRCVGLTGCRQPTRCHSTLSPPCHCSPHGALPTEEIQCRCHLHFPHVSPVINCYPRVSRGCFRRGSGGHGLVAGRSIASESKIQGLQFRRYVGRYIRYSCISVGPDRNQDRPKISALFQISAKYSCVPLPFSRDFEPSPKCPLKY